MVLSLPEKIDSIQEILVKRKAQVSIGNCVQSVLMFWKTWEPKAWRLWSIFEFPILLETWNVHKCFLRNMRIKKIKASVASNSLASHQIFKKNASAIFYLLDYLSILFVCFVQVWSPVTNTTWNLVIDILTILRRDPIQCGVKGPECISVIFPFTNNIKELKEFKRR